MKRIVTFVAAAATSLSLMAEGYQINTLSTKQLGMGHAGVAMKLGSESMIFNPAGLAFSNKTIDISGAITGIKATAKATIDGKQYETDNGMSTPLAINAAFKIYDNLQAGVAFYTPYGSAINWGDNWAGAILNQKVTLKTYTIQPTFSWRITPKLSIGAGLMMTWGSVDLNKGLVTGSSFDAMLGQQVFGNITPASVNLKGTAEVVCGVNIGAMYEINDKITVGASWRSKMMAKVKTGDAYVNYANDEIAKKHLEPTLKLINEANFKAEMPLPQVISFGVAYKPIDRLTIALDAQYTGWSTYKSLDFDFLLDEQFDHFDQHIEKEYEDAWCFKAGAQFALTNRFDVRAGLMFDTTPVNDQYYNPETPGMTKIEPTVGFSFRPTDSFSVDFAFMYVAGLGKDKTRGIYNDFLTQQQREIIADYKVHAFAPSLGVSYSF